MLKGGGGLKITGGKFDGVIYVIGEFNMASGNPDIKGAIFIECDESYTTPIRGSVEIEYDSAEVIGALGHNPFPFQRDKTSNSWREIHQ